MGVFLEMPYVVYYITIYTSEMFLLHYGTSGM